MRFETINPWSGWIAASIGLSMESRLITQISHGGVKVPKGVICLISALAFLRNASRKALRQRGCKPRRGGHATVSALPTRYASQLPRSPPA
jgi:hypothetical protein